MENGEFYMDIDDEFLDSLIPEDLVLPELEQEELPVRSNIVVHGSDVPIAKTKSAPVKQKSQRRKALTNKDKISLLKREIERLNRHLTHLRDEWRSKEILKRKQSNRVFISSSEKENLRLKEVIRAKQQLIQMYHGTLLEKSLSDKFTIVDYLHAHLHLGEDAITRTNQLFWHGELKLDQAYTFIDQEFNLMDQKTHQTSFKSFIKENTFYITMYETQTMKGEFSSIANKLQNCLFNCENAIQKLTDVEIIEETLTYFGSGGKYIGSTLFFKNKKDLQEQSRLVHYNKIDSDRAIYTIDFVDHDEAFPLKKQNSLRRDIVGVQSLTKKQLPGQKPIVEWKAVTCAKIDNLESMEEDLEDYLFQQRQLVTSVSYLIQKSIR